MKFIYKSLLDVYEKAEESLAKEGRSSYGIKYVKQTVSFRYQFLHLSSHQKKKKKKILHL